MRGIAYSQLLPPHATCEKALDSRVHAQVPDSILHAERYAELAECLDGAAHALRLVRAHVNAGVDDARKATQARKRRLELPLRKVRVDENLVR